MRKALISASFDVQQGMSAKKGNVYTSMIPVAILLEGSMCLPRSPYVVAV